MRKKVGVEWKTWVKSVLECIGLRGKRYHNLIILIKYFLFLKEKNFREQTVEIHNTTSKIVDTFAVFFLPRF